MSQDLTTPNSHRTASTITLSTRSHSLPKTWRTAGPSAIFLVRPTPDTSSSASRLRRRLARWSSPCAICSRWDFVWGFYLFIIYHVGKKTVIEADRKTNRQTSTHMDKQREWRKLVRDSSSFNYKAVVTRLNETALIIVSFACDFHHPGTWPIFHLF